MEASKETPLALMRPRKERLGQVLLALVPLILAAVLAHGARSIPAEAGYAGIGPNFLPWLMCAMLTVCGIGLLYQALGKGFVSVELPAHLANLPAFAWVSAGILSNALLIERIGFILSCALCYTLAVRGMRIAQEKSAGDVLCMLRDFAIGMAISAPVYWLFTKVLQVRLPGLTDSGWI